MTGAARHLITGATSGIGSAIADLLYERGDDLVLLVRNEERAAQLQERFSGATTVLADLSQPLEDLALPDPLDTLIHSAGVVDLGPVAELASTAIEEQIRVNLIAPAELTRRCLPALRSSRGLVLFVNSTSGLQANPGWAGYAASKFGLRGFADALRAEETQHGVRVSSLFPSRTATAMQQRVHAAEGKDYAPEDWMSPQSVARSALGILDLPPDATITDLTVRTHR